MYVFYALLVEADRHRVSLAERVELSDDDLKPGSGVLYHLDAGLRPTLRDLATLMMMLSDNSAMIFLSQYLGLDTINREIDRLGLAQTWLGDRRCFDTEYADSMKFGIGENLISKISLAIYDCWAPLYSTGESNDNN